TRRKDARACEATRVPDVRGLHGGDAGRDLRIGRGRVARRLGRPGRLPPDRRGPLRGTRAGRIVPVAADRGAGTGDPTRRLNSAGGSGAASGERPFVWTTWWTRRWTNPLPAATGQAYDWPPTGPRLRVQARTGVGTTGSRRDRAVRPLRVPCDAERERG